MTRRDWIAAGAMFLGIGSGVLCWSAGAGDMDWIRTALGAGPILGGLLALSELCE